MMILKPAWPPECPELKHNRLYMRPPQSSDCQEWLNIRARNKDHLVPYEPKWPEDALTESFFKRRLQRQMQDWQRDQSYSFLLFSNENNRMIGGMNINSVSRGAAQFASIGYWIDQDFQNQGLMGEAIDLTLQFGFHYLRLERINAATLADNRSSRHVLTRAGFVEEGFARGYVQINGLRADHVLYGLNKDDWPH